MDPNTDVIYWPLTYPNTQCRSQSVSNFLKVNSLEWENIVHPCRDISAVHWLQRAYFCSWSSPVYILTIPSQLWGRIISTIQDGIFFWKITNCWFHISAASHLIQTEEDQQDNNDWGLWGYSLVWVTMSGIAKSPQFTHTPDIKAQG